MPSLGAYYVYGRLISQAGPATAGLSMFLVPVYAALLAWPLLGEAPQLFHAYGFVMILLGVRLASLRGAAGRQPPPPGLIRPRRDQRPPPWPR